MNFLHILILCYEVRWHSRMPHSSGKSKHCSCQHFNTLPKGINSLDTITKCNKRCNRLCSLLKVIIKQIFRPPNSRFPRSTRTSMENLAHTQRNCWNLFIRNNPSHALSHTTLQYMETKGSSSRGAHQVRLSLSSDLLTSCYNLKSNINR